MTHHDYIVWSLGYPTLCVSDESPKYAAAQYAEIVSAKSRSQVLVIPRDAPEAAELFQVDRCGYTALPRGKTNA